MHYSKATVVVAALSIGQAMAGPTHAHLHRHRDVHAKKDVDWKALDWENMGIDWTSAWKAGQQTSTVAPVPVPTPTEAPVVSAPASTTEAPVSSASPTAEAKSNVADSSASLWNGLVGASNHLVSFGKSAIGGGHDIERIGNIGSPQGSNMIKVDSTSGYDFTNKFINTSKKSMTIVLWNKAYSRDDDVKNADANLGACLAPTSPALTIALAPGESQIVAFQDGTLMGWSEAVDGRTPSSAFATSWGEASFKSEALGESGYDLSAILNPEGNNYWIAISSAEVPCISDPTQNYWEAKDGNPLTPVPIGSSDGSCYVPGNSAHLTTEMGGYF